VATSNGKGSERVSGDGVMNPVLARFLAEVRLRGRPRHWPVYEDLAWGLESSLRRRRGSASQLRRRHALALLEYGYLRHHQPLTARSARRFAAAARVFAHWWVRQDRPGEPFIARVQGLTRALARAARASELLDTLRCEGSSFGMTAQLDDYFEIVVRGGSHVVVRKLESRALVGPVAVTEQLAAALDPGAFVNLRLAREEGRWRIVETGSCYPASARAALVQSRASGR